MTRVSQINKKHRQSIVIFRYVHLLHGKFTIEPNTIQIMIIGDAGKITDI